LQSVKDATLVDGDILNATSVVAPFVNEKSIFNAFVIHNSIKETR